MDTMTDLILMTILMSLVKGCMITTNGELGGSGVDSTGGKETNPSIGQQKTKKVLTKL